MIDCSMQNVIIAQITDCFYQLIDIFLHNFLSLFSCFAFIYFFFQVYFNKLLEGNSVVFQFKNGIYICFWVPFVLGEDVQNWTNIRS
jgi:hypothetical protein